MENGEGIVIRTRGADRGRADWEGRTVSALQCQRPAEYCNANREQGAGGLGGQDSIGVAMSTTDAEYAALNHAAREAVWLHYILLELQPIIQITLTIPIFTDNEAALALAHNPVFHSRTKHIDISYHFLRDLVQNGTLDVIYVQTDNNPAHKGTGSRQAPETRGFYWCPWMRLAEGECWNAANHIDVQAPKPRRYQSGNGLIDRTVATL